MNHEEKIKAIEAQLQAEETKINGLLRAGKVPTKADYADLDRIKNELKEPNGVSSNIPAFVAIIWLLSIHLCRQILVGLAI